MPISIHGDAAFAVQGVVGETLQLWQLRGCRTGGTLHVVVNGRVREAPTATKATAASPISRRSSGSAFSSNEPHKTSLNWL
jgi:multifunctional 2-oxoglutarate metabolism enzyme